MTTTGVCSINNVPQDVLSLVFGHLSPQDQIQASAVSRIFYDAMLDHRLEAGAARAMLRISPQPEVAQVYSNPDPTRRYGIVAETNTIRVFGESSNKKKE